MKTNPLKELRQERGLNRSEFSRQTGVSYPTLCTLEGGLMNTMQKKTAIKIAEFSQKSPAELQEEYRQWKESLKHAE